MSSPFTAALPRWPAQRFKRSVSALSVGDAIVVLLASTVVLGGILFRPMMAPGIAGDPATRARFLAPAFDVVPIFGTVGLSTGITPELSLASWPVLTAFILVGRVGPLTLGLALAGRRARSEPVCAGVSIMVG